MKKFSTWLLVMFMIMYWVFRIIVAVTDELGIEFYGLKTLDMRIEVVLLFIVLVCIILVIKRNTIGALVYFLSYGLYFGVDAYNSIMAIAKGGNVADTGLNAFASIIGIVLSVAVLIDLLLDKNRKANPVDKKTDWYYKNEEYDRKMDDRADKNNYRTL